MEMKAHERQRMAANREELVERVSSLVREDGDFAPVPGLHLVRLSQPTGVIHGTSQPSVCIAVQGAKDVFLGDQRYRYDTENYLLPIVELPITSLIFEASEERPYLSLRLELDPALVASVMVEWGFPTPRSYVDAKALAVSPLDPGLLDAMARLVRLLDSHEETRGIMPLVKREIVYRLLIGEQGNRLRHLPALGGTLTVS